MMALESEVALAELGDKRLNKRLSLIVERSETHPTTELNLTRPNHVQRVTPVLWIFLCVAARIARQAKKASIFLISYVQPNVATRQT